MRKLLFLICFICISAFGQITGNPTKFNFGIQFPNKNISESSDSLKIPVFDSETLNNFIYKSDIITDAQIAWIRSQMYQNLSASFSISPTQGERGVAIPITVNYNIASNDDVITAASINQGIGSVLANVNAGAKSVSGGSKTANTTYTLTLNFTRNGVPQTQTTNATYNSRVPQWAGWSSATDFSTYAELEAEVNLQKYIQSNSAITKSFSPDGEYIWFITTNATGQILDGNNFVQTVGTWGDGVSEFYRKSLSLTLADGSTSATVYLYRSRNVKTLSNFTYKSN